MKARVIGFCLAAALAACDSGEKAAKSESALPPVALEEAWSADGFKQPESVVFDPDMAAGLIRSIIGLALF